MPQAGWKIREIPMDERGKYGNGIMEESRERHMEKRTEKEVGTGLGDSSYSGRLRLPFGMLSGDGQ